MNYSIAKSKDTYVVDGASRTLYFNDLKEAQLIVITLYYLKDMEYIINQSSETAESLAIKKILSAKLADESKAANILLEAGIMKLNELIN